MSDILKCPYCGGVLEQTSIYNLNSYACTDLNCKGYFMTATRSMWQELIRTRKALEKAKLVLANLRDYAELDGIQECDVYEALEQITALEQKD